nr:gfo/Idh/MocA family oxidoreductase [Verrucomicrobiota bacterium]
GEDGWIFVEIHGQRLEASNPTLLEENPETLSVKVGRSPGHHQNFLEAVQGKAQPIAPAEVGHRTATICHLANIAMAVGSPLKWDPKTERITNNEQANAMIAPAMRQPWTV